MRTVLPLGMGLDRYTGVMQVDASSMQDMRNLRPLMGKLQARRGTIVQDMLPDQGGNPCTQVTLLQPVRSQSEGIAVGYYRASREVHVFRIGGDGTNPQHIGKWFDLPASAASPPYFTGAESYGRAFIAHDEARQTRRAVTQVYDAVAGTLADLTADLRGMGDEPVLFRGVSAWSNYLVGWGFGHAGEIRPEIVRISKPGQPELFDRGHYFIAGDRASPVTTVKQSGSHLIVLKPTESYRILGTSRLDFGIAPFYSLFGCLGTRLAVSVEGIMYAWSFEGPWSAAPQAQDLEDPISLETPFPVDLPAASSSRDAFAVYIPGERVIEWHFGDRIYALSLSDGGLRWSFRNRVMGRAACGALMYSIAFGETLADGTGTVPAAGPAITNVAAEGGTATVTWENDQQDGTELLEVWLAQTSSVTGTGKLTTGVAFLNPTYERRLPDRRVTADTQQTTDVAVPNLGQSYSVAVRYRRGNMYSPGYESDDPGDWPVGSRQAFDSRPSAPTIDNAQFIRTSVSQVVMRVSLTPAVNHEAYEHNVYRDGVKIGSSLAGAEQTFEDTGPTVGMEHSYTARAVVHGVESPDSVAFVAFAGPPPPENPRYLSLLMQQCGPGELLYNLFWSYPTVVFSGFLTARIQYRRGPTGTPRLVDAGRVNVIPCADATDPMFAVRLYTTNHGVNDYSPWVDAVAATP